MDGIDLRCPVCDEDFANESATMAALRAAMHVTDVHPEFDFGGFLRASRRTTLLPGPCRPRRVSEGVA